jgi:hypothetical protein
MPLREIFLLRTAEPHRKKLDGLACWCAGSARLVRRSRRLNQSTDHFGRSRLRIGRPLVTLRFVRVTSCPVVPTRRGIFIKEKAAMPAIYSAALAKKSTLAASVTSSPHSLHANVRSSGRPPNLGIVLVCCIGLPQFGQRAVTDHSSCCAFGRVWTAQH